MVSGPFEFVNRSSDGVAALDGSTQTTQFPLILSEPPHAMSDRMETPVICKLFRQILTFRIKEHISPAKVGTGCES